MTEAAERMVEKIQVFAAALAAFGDAVRGVGEVFRRFAHQYQVAMARTEREKRRLIRDWQRFNRRPALIHNGRRPR